MPKKQMIQLTYLGQDTVLRVGMIGSRCYIAFRNKKTDWVGFSPGDAFICKTIAEQFKAMAEYYEKKSNRLVTH